MTPTARAVAADVLHRARTAKAFAGLLDFVRRRGLEDRRHLFIDTFAPVPATIT